MAWGADTEGVRTARAGWRRCAAIVLTGAGALAAPLLAPAPARAAGDPQPPSLAKQLRTAKAAQADEQKAVKLAEGRVGVLERRVTELEQKVSSLDADASEAYRRYVAARDLLGRIAIAHYVSGGAAEVDLGSAQDADAFALQARSEFYSRAADTANANVVGAFAASRQSLLDQGNQALTDLDKARSDLALASTDRESHAAALEARAADVKQIDMLLHLQTATANVAPSDIPLLFVDAYQRAANALAKTQPACKLPWWALAGIGRIESGHGRSGGAQLSLNGDLNPIILGPVLDGSNGFAAIPDTDQGQYDTDPMWDRAVGPMQFIPSTWARMGKDGNNDKVMNPDNAYDAALAAANYLCRAVPAGGLDQDPALMQAFYSYNHSDAYVQNVLAAAHEYQAMNIGPVRPVAVPK